MRYTVGKHSRDTHHIIIQTEPGRIGYADGGDSAFSTGLMSLAGNFDDTLLMPEFIINNKLVRHPYQSQWNTPGLESRDQVIAFFSGLPRLLSYSAAYSGLFYSKVIRTRQSCLTYARGWFVNKDILLPHVKYYLYLCAGARPPVLLKPFAYLFLYLSIFYDSYLNPNHEMNQSICIANQYGVKYLKLLNKHHPDLIGNVKEYFCVPWRDKKFMYETIGDYLKERLK